MTIKAISTTALFCALTAGSAGTLAAQGYPDRPIEMIVTFGPGSGADIMGRTASQLLEERLGVPLPVSNVAGASGNAAGIEIGTVGRQEEKTTIAHSTHAHNVPDVLSHVMDGQGTSDISVICNGCCHHRS